MAGYYTKLAQQQGAIPAPAEPTPTPPPPPPPIEMPEAAENPFEPLSADRLHELRMMIVRGEDVEDDDLIAAYMSLRMDRSKATRAASQPTKRKARASKAPPPNLDDLLNTPT